MKIIHALVFASALFITACNNSNTDSQNRVFNQALFSSYQHRDTSLSEKRTELSFSGGVAAKNCSSYLVLAPKHDLEESVNNQIIKSEYLVCDALGLLAGTRKLDYQDASRSDYGKQLSRKLDLRSFPSSLHRMSDADKYTLNSLFPGQVTTRGNLAILNTDDWTFRLEVVASVKLDNNNQPDWIIWLSDEAKVGNYRAYTTLVVYNPASDNSFKARVYP